MGYRVVRKHDNMFSRFDTMPTCDGQTDRRTDRQTDRIGISKTCLRIAADARKNWLLIEFKMITSYPFFYCTYISVHALL